jgi:hypothetical protein
MTDAQWEKARRLFEDNQAFLQRMPPADPIPSAVLCRESAHRTLGHLVACQAAWLPIVHAIREGALEVTIPINPDPLYRKSGFNALPWASLLERFIADREEWRETLDRIDVRAEVRTPRRTYSAQTLTGRMVEHERRHLAECPRD